MLIAALVLAVIGLTALVAAVVTSNEVIAWVCIGASAIGVVVLIVDAVRERQRRDAAADTDADSASELGAGEQFDEDYPDEVLDSDPHSDGPHSDGPHSDGTEDHSDDVKTGAIDLRKSTER